MVIVETNDATLQGGDKTNNDNMVVEAQSTPATRTTTERPSSPFSVAAVPTDEIPTSSNTKSGSADQEVVDDDKENDVGKRTVVDNNLESVNSTTEVAVEKDIAAAAVADATTITTAVSDITNTKEVVCVDNSGNKYEIEVGDSATTEQASKEDGSRSCDDGDKMAKAAASTTITSSITFQEIMEQTAAAAEASVTKGGKQIAAHVEAISATADNLKDSMSCTAQTASPTKNALFDADDDEAEDDGIVDQEGEEVTITASGKEETTTTTTATTAEETVAVNEKNQGNPSNSNKSISSWMKSFPWRGSKSKNQDSAATTTPNDSKAQEAQSTMEKTEEEAERNVVAASSKMDEMDDEPGRIITKATSGSSLSPPTMTSTTILQGHIKDNNERDVVDDVTEQMTKLLEQTGESVSTMGKEIMEKAETLANVADLATDGACTLIRDDSTSMVKDIKAHVASKQMQPPTSSSPQQQQQQEMQTEPTTSGGSPRRKMNWLRGLSWRSKNKKNNSKDEEDEKNGKLVQENEARTEPEATNRAIPITTSSDPNVEIQHDDGKQAEEQAGQKVGEKGKEPDVLKEMTDQVSEFLEQTSQSLTTAGMELLETAESVASAVVQPAEEPALSGSRSDSPTRKMRNLFKNFSFRSKNKKNKGDQQHGTTTPTNEVESQEPTIHTKTVPIATSTDANVEVAVMEQQQEEEQTKVDEQKKAEDQKKEEDQKREEEHKREEEKDVMKEMTDQVSEFLEQTGQSLTAAGKGLYETAESVAASVVNNTSQQQVEDLKQEGSSDSRTRPSPTRKLKSFLKGLSFRSKNTKGDPVNRQQQTGDDVGSASKKKEPDDEPIQAKSGPVISSDDPDPELKDASGNDPEGEVSDVGGNDAKAEVGKGGGDERKEAVDEAPEDVVKDVTEQVSEFLEQTGQSIAAAGMELLETAETVAAVVATDAGSCNANYEESAMVEDIKQHVVEKTKVKQQQRNLHETTTSPSISPGEQSTRAAGDRQSEKYSNAKTKWLPSWIGKKSKSKEQGSLTTTESNEDDKKHTNETTNEMKNLIDDDYEEDVEDEPGRIRVQEKKTTTTSSAAPLDMLQKSTGNDATVNPTTEGNEENVIDAEDDAQLVEAGGDGSNAAPAEQKTGDEGGVAPGSAKEVEVLNHELENEPRERPLSVITGNVPDKEKDQGLDAPISPGSMKWWSTTPKSIVPNPPPLVSHQHITKIEDRLNRAVADSETSSARQQPVIAEGGEEPNDSPDENADTENNADESGKAVMDRVETLVNDMTQLRRQLKQLVVVATNYYESTKRNEAARKEFVERLSILSEDSPLYNPVGRTTTVGAKEVVHKNEDDVPTRDARLNQTDGDDPALNKNSNSKEKEPEPSNSGEDTAQVRAPQEVAETEQRQPATDQSTPKKLEASPSGVQEGTELTLEKHDVAPSYKVLEDKASSEAPDEAEEFHDTVVKYAMEWELIVTSRMQRDYKFVRQLNKSRTFYANKLVVMKQKVEGMEAKGKEVPEWLVEKVQKKEEKLQIATKAHSKHATELCVWMEEATQRGYQDLIPMVERTMEWEETRLQRRANAFLPTLPTIRNTVAQLAPTTDDGQL